MVNFAVAAVSPLLLHLYWLKLINIILKTVCCFAEVAIINFFQKKVFCHLERKCLLEVIWRKTMKHAFSMFYCKDNEETF